MKKRSDEWNGDIIVLGRLLHILFLDAYLEASQLGERSSGVIRGVFTRIASALGRMGLQELI